MACMLITDVKKPQIIFGETCNIYLRLVSNQAPKRVSSALDSVTF